MHDFPNHYTLQDGIYSPASQSKPFEYSDGEEFELTIKNIITSAQDRSLFSPELRNAYWDWRSSCHLSPVRANILRPLEEKCRGRVLELGSGCGIISRYLGELGSDLVALEASPLRAKITQLRTEDLNNVSVVCDRIEDFDSEKKFDVVTMIGVLQYARLFSSCGENAELTFIKNAARQLKSDGVLVIAIQNKLSLKSLSGNPEPNVGIPYFGIEGKYGSESIVRFGLDEIKDILSSAGLPYQAVLLPFPDYHMPVSILNEHATKPGSPFRAESLLTTSVNRDRARPDWVSPEFSLEQAWQTVQSSGATAHLSNAFLVIAGKTEESVSFHREMNEFAWHYSVDRYPAFATQKRFIATDNGVKISSSLLHTQSKPDVPLKHSLKNEIYINGQLWWERLVKIVNTPGWSVSDLAAWTQPWLNAIQDESKLEALDLDNALPGTLYDFTPFNCIESLDGSLNFIDREWEVDSLTSSHLILRGLFGSLIGLSSSASPSPETPVVIIQLIQAVLAALGLNLTNEHIEHFLEKESRIQNWVNKGNNNETHSAWAKYIRTARLNCRVSKREIEKSLTETKNALAKAEINRKKAQESLMLIQLSNSWRITAPLRKIKKLLRL